MAHSNELQRFAFPDTGQSLRTILIDGEPWFVAADACAVLDHSNPTMAVAGLDEDEKGLSNVETLGGHQQMVVINEPGLYSLILRSRKPEARAFKRWITHEVLPALRRTGRYSIAEVSRKDLARMVIEVEEEKERLAARVAELEPDAARARQTMDADGLALVGTVAKRFGIQERKLREFLYSDGILIRQGLRRNEPMARHVQAGYFELKVTLIGEPVRERSTTYVTPRGEAFIWRRLVAAGIRSGQMPARQLELV